MYEEYYEKYMKNSVSIATLDKLVTAGKLTRAQVNQMIDDRLEKYGY